ncbi:MAG: helix-turn-helix transcriptional regulator [Candidatus Limnocylindria bacterium]
MTMLVDEWRSLRATAGISQATLARALRVSRSTYASIEQGRLAEIGLRRACAITAILGGDLSVRIYPAGPPLRDAGYLALLARFDSRLAATWRIRHEAPMPQAGDLRAWDRRLDGPTSIGVEAETRPRDLQKLERSMNLKQRDSGVLRMVLLVSGTRRNRELVRAALPMLRPTFPLSTSEVLRALAEGRDPGANGLVVL